MPNATDIRNAAAHIEANDGQPGEIEWLRHWLREGADLIGQLYAIMEDPHAVQWNMKTGQIATPTNWGWFTDEDNTLRAELKRLREELMQQNELRRMEAEALMGAAKEVNRMLRAEIERLREAIAQIALTNTNGILSRPDKNDRITAIINKALEA